LLVVVRKENFKDSKKTVKATWRLCESSESSDTDEGTVGHVYEIDSRTHERVIVKDEEKPVDFIVDTGSSSVIITKQTYLDFNKNQDISLNRTGVKLTPYGSDNPLNRI
jgi:predicted aspartyl protease